jgi:hypothetical protein
MALSVKTTGPACHLAPHAVNALGMGTGVPPKAIQFMGAMARPCPRKAKRGELNSTVAIGVYRVRAFDRRIA